MSSMVRKQVYLTAELDERLRREAARQRRSEAEILREALAVRLGVAEKEGADASADPLWNLVGIDASSDGDLSQNLDDILYGAAKLR